MAELTISADEIRSAIESYVSSYSPEASREEVGVVAETGDGIARVEGLPSAMTNELLEFEGGVLGIALNLDVRDIGVVILGDASAIEEGQSVKRTGEILSVPVGDAYLGRVVNPLGNPIDGQGEIETTERRALELQAPTVVQRKEVREPLLTGIKAIDAMTAIGRGQRQLIIGDRQTGKTAVCRRRDHQPARQLEDRRPGQAGQVHLRRDRPEGLHHRSACVVAPRRGRRPGVHHHRRRPGRSDAAGFKYLAPYTGSSIGQHWMYDGKHVLIVFDDLSKQAEAYRAVSLLLRRPPGREAYPGDVFYLHSRLLERCAKLSDELGGGSMTGLPIIETKGNDVSAYIPTNVISITDGQCFLETDLFNAGVRPAINVGISVSRVGGSAQIEGDAVGRRLGCDSTSPSTASWRRSRPSPPTSTRPAKAAAGARLSGSSSCSSSRPVLAVLRSSRDHRSRSGRVRRASLDDVPDRRHPALRGASSSTTSPASASRRSSTAIVATNNLEDGTIEQLRGALEDFKKTFTTAEGKQLVGDEPVGSLESPEFAGEHQPAPADPARRRSPGGRPGSRRGNLRRAGLRRQPRPAIPPQSSRGANPSARSAAASSATKSMKKITKAIRADRRIAHRQGAERRSEQLSKPYARRRLTRVAHGGQPRQTTLQHHHAHRSSRSPTPPRPRILLISSDRGLAGAYSANAIRTCERTGQRTPAQGEGKNARAATSSGRKGVSVLRLPQPRHQAGRVVHRVLGAAPILRRRQAGSPTPSWQPVTVTSEGTVQASGGAGRRVGRQRG